MSKIIVAGIGTDVGKTVVSAILVNLLQGDYWKPIQSGKVADESIMQKLIDTTEHSIFPSTYSFKAPLSPHQAASLENIAINLKTIVPPTTKRTLIIESVGGVFVPLTTNKLTIDLFKKWNCPWILVSKHYLGSINHTLLTIKALQLHNIAIMGLIFNGQPNHYSEAPILEITQLPILGRLLPEANITKKIIKKYAKQWRPNFILQLP